MYMVEFLEDFACDLLVLVLTNQTPLWPTNFSPSHLQASLFQLNPQIK